MKNRTLKVRSGYYDYQLTGKKPYSARLPVPFLLLKGYWLQQVNFDIGKTVSVELKENQLILTIKH